MINVWNVYLINYLNDKKIVIFSKFSLNELINKQLVVLALIPE